MPHHGPRRLLQVLAFAGLVPFTAAAEPADAATRGRLLYEQGLRADGRLLEGTAGADRAPLPASFAACVNCHGANGRGRIEGGLTVPPIDWGQLDKPYGAALPTGRRRAAYDEAAFHAALTRGVDPSGQPLASTMPRYELSPRESADLAAYLRRIGERSVPGVREDTILLGWRAPDGPPARITAAVLEAWCAEVNANGGIFRRHLRPVASNEGADAVFAVLFAGDSRADGETARTLARSGVPVLVAGRAPSETEGRERNVFALFPAEALIAPLGEMPPQSMADYLAFARRHGLPAEEQDLQLALLASAKLLLEGLKNAGRELDREKFVAALETLSEVETGFTPPAGFTPRRHIAAPGAYAKPTTRDALSPP